LCPLIIPPPTALPPLVFCSCRIHDIVLLNLLVSTTYYNNYYYYYYYYHHHHHHYRVPLTHPAMRGNSGKMN